MEGSPMIARAVAALMTLSVGTALSLAPSVHLQATTPTAIALPAELDRVLRDYEAAWKSGDGPRLAGLFTEDGFAIQSGRPIARGRDAIARGLTKPGGSLQLTAYAYAASADVGHIVGGFRYPETAGPGGRFVLALRRGADGRWLIAADLDNSGPR
jgi:ketosteroid isomerase-like protein